MAFGVDRFPNPQENPEGHYEYDRIDGEVIRYFVRDYDDDGNAVSVPEGESNGEKKEALQEGQHPSSRARDPEVRRLGRQTGRGPGEIERKYE